MVADYYAMLGVEPSAGRGAIEAALAKAQPLWSAGTRNPKNKHTFQSYLDQIPAIRRTLLGDPALRAAYDAELAAVRRADRDRALDRLQRLVRIRAAKGGLTVSDRALLKGKAANLGLDAAPLERLLAPYPPMPEAPAEAEAPEPAADVIDPATRRQIRIALEHLRRSDLYDVLGLPRDAPASEIAAKADAERQRWMQKSQVTAEKTAWLEAVSYAQSHLASPEARARYDRTLAAEAEEALGETIGFALKGTRALAAATRRFLREEALTLGITAERADRLIDRACRAAGVARDGGGGDRHAPRAGAVPAVPGVRGAHGVRPGLAVARLGRVPPLPGPVAVEVPGVPAGPVGGRAPLRLRVPAGGRGTPRPLLRGRQPRPPGAGLRRRAGGPEAGPGLRPPARGGPQGDREDQGGPGPDRQPPRDLRPGALAPPPDRRPDRAGGLGPAGRPLLHRPAQGHARGHDRVARGAVPRGPGADGRRLGPGRRPRGVPQGPGDRRRPARRARRPAPLPARAAHEPPRRDRVGPRAAPLDGPPARRPGALRLSGRPQAWRRAGPRGGRRGRGRGRSLRIRRRHRHPRRHRGLRRVQHEVEHRLAGGRVGRPPADPGRRGQPAGGGRLPRGRPVVDPPAEQRGGPGGAEARSRPHRPGGRGARGLAQGAGDRPGAGRRPRVPLRRVRRVPHQQRPVHRLARGVRLGHAHHADRHGGGGDPDPSRRRPGADRLDAPGAGQGPRPAHRAPGPARPRGPDRPEGRRGPGGELAGPHRRRPRPGPPTARDGRVPLHPHDRLGRAVHRGAPRRVLARARPHRPPRRALGQGGQGPPPLAMVPPRGQGPRAREGRGVPLGPRRPPGAGVFGGGSGVQPPGVLPGRPAPERRRPVARGGLHRGDRRGARHRVAGAGAVLPDRRARPPRRGRGGLRPPPAGPVRAHLDGRVPHRSPRIDDPPTVLVAHPRTVPLSADDGETLARLPETRDGEHVSLKLPADQGAHRLRIFPDPRAEPDGQPPIRLRHPEAEGTRV